MRMALPLRIAMILVPIGCFILVCVEVGIQVVRLRAASLEAARIDREMATVEQGLADIGKRAVPTRVAAVPATPKEQPQFLDVLRAYAALSRVKLVRWDAVQPPPPGQAQSKTDLQLPDGVTAMVSTVQVEGRYGQVREFLYRVMYAPRLYTMTAPTWRRDPARATTHITLTITRYVRQ